MSASKLHEEVILRARNAFSAGQTLSLSFREDQLKNMLKMLDENEVEMVNALKKDLRKSKMEATLYELEVLRADIKILLRNLKKYAQGEKLPFNFLSMEDSARVQPDPYGLVLILGAWNYPFSLALQPMAGAIAAGNVVILKPSEYASNTAATIARLVPRYLDNECFHVIEADLEETKELLKNQFDYIFATGSIGMGKSVMAAAAPHLTPVTLELGGKSPAYIDDNCDIETTAKRLLWGKWINMGQTCIAPDYILCSEKMEKKFLQVASRVMTEWYGKEWKKSPDLPRIINDKSFQRLKNILERTKGTIAFGGGETDQKERWISPTVIVDVLGNDATMEDEIFGPILPIVRCENPDEALHFITSRPKPLALYVFSNNKKLINKFLTKTSSGGACVNDVVWQNGFEGLPFGGVGPSGMGNYHGKYSFDTFSHKKAILSRGTSALTEKLSSPRYPPYNENKIKYFKLVIRYFHAFNAQFGGMFTKLTTHLVAAGIGVASVILYNHFNNN